MIVIKSVSEERFEIKLIQSQAGQYYIETATYAGEDGREVNNVMSDPMDDFSLASFVFDARLASIQGH